MIEPQQEIINAVCLAGLYLVIFTIGEFIHRILPSKIELSRKFVHLSGGLIALLFPYFIKSHWTVLLLAITFTSIIILTKKKGILKSVHGIKRISYGGIYFPISIYLIFLLSQTKVNLYFISILVMTISDALAALIGEKYGIIKFDVEGNIKTLEGSMVFFFVTFLCIHLPLLLMTDIGRLESVLIAFIIAILVTGFEAISLSGSDNIFVPFGTYYILSKMTSHSISVIIEQMQILFFIIVITIIIFRFPKTLEISGLIGIILLNYAAWSLCGFYWFLPLFLAQIMYHLLILAFMHSKGAEKIASFQIKVLFYTGIIPSILIFTANTVSHHNLIYLPYIVSITGQIAIISNFFFTNIFLKNSKLLMGLLCIISATIFVAILPILLYPNGFSYSSIFVIGTGTLIAYCADLFIKRYYGADRLLEHQIRFLGVGIGVISIFIGQMLIRGWVNYGSHTIR